MEKMRVLEEISIELDDNEIIRMLGNKKSRKKVSADLMNEIAEMKKLSLDTIKPKGVYDVLESKELEPRFLFNKSEKTILAVCTIGRELEELISRYMQRGELAKGVILDAIASHAAEQTAEQLNQIILNEIKDEIKDKEITHRFSPGYCQWVLEEGQKLIFRMLPTETIDVTLSVTMMMKPIKSVSFAINIGDKVDKELGIGGCETCEMANCVYRRN
ncbi:MAG: hypothetical protein KAS63_03805 [Candidatus Heimdallarchaeota archaeon]|nr:hypothetical protein [Candidatus Heimdallarchaeota archaeon]MCK4954458.1 hypothetical protein [Candidatus Heimdallarchaeota archaeon]